MNTSEKIEGSASAPAPAATPERTEAAAAGRRAQLSLYAVMRGYAVDGRAALQAGDYEAADTALLLLSAMAGHFWAEAGPPPPGQEERPPSDPLTWTAADNRDFFALPALRRLTSALRRAAPEAERVNALFPDAFPPILIRILASIADRAAAGPSQKDPELEAALKAAGVAYTAPPGAAPGN